MRKIKVDIYGIAPSQMQGSYSLILAEEDGERKIPVIVGQYEAQAIAIQIEGINTGRPLTHDLFLSFAQQFEISIKEVFIHQLKEGIFYSLLVCESNGKVHEIDSRTSDAIALAVRFDCPIYTTEEILEAAGITIDDKSVEKPGRGKADVPAQKPKEDTDLFKSKTLDELEKMLNKALNNEDYLKAAQIRDEIDKRK